MTCSFRWLAILALTVLAGCGGPTASPTPSPPLAQNPMPAAPMPAAPMTPQPMPAPPMTPAESPMPVAEKKAPALKPESIIIEEVDKAGYEAALARHKGKVIFVDFWATWCPTCMEKFPHTVELAHKYNAKDFVVLSMSFDDPGDEMAIEDAKKFLAKQGADFEHYVTALDIQESIKAFDVGTSIPHFKMYDRAGKLRHTFEPSPNEEFDPVKMEVLIRELIAEKP